MTRTQGYLPLSRATNAQGQSRHVGIEVEIARLSLAQTLGTIRRCLGGQLELESLTQGKVRNTSLGDFEVEFDHSILKERTYLKPLQRIGLLADEHSEAAQRIEQSVLRLAGEIVPVEIITPPIPWPRLCELDVLWNALRAEGAADTYAALRYAFGLHLNLELPDDTTDTLRDYLRAYVLLEDWLFEVSRVDLSRKLSPFIKRFPESYRRKILDERYAPSAQSLLGDYLEHNPTRNRSLDLLPLLMHRHGNALLSRVREAHLMKPRPAVHYRLPNCELASVGWSPALAWNHWLAVEQLAQNAERLRVAAARYLQGSRAAS